MVVKNRVFYESVISCGWSLGVQCHGVVKRVKIIICFVNEGVMRRNRN